MKKYTQRTCDVCGSTFEHWHYETKYCSKPCTNKAYYSRNRTKQLNKDTQLKKVYGISIEDYKQLFKKQNGVCAICNEPETQVHNKTKQVLNLCVDHDHDTGFVRGLLCKKCNMALGLLQDSSELLQTATNYLKAAQVKAMRG